jgi:hypothetical protein
MPRKVSFYEVTPDEKSRIFRRRKSSTSTHQKPTYPDWKKGDYGLLPSAPPAEEVYKGCFYDKFMNRSRFTIRANGGRVCCVLYEKPCSIKRRDRSNVRGHIVIQNVSKADFCVDKYTELGLLLFGYCGFTHLASTFALNKI